MTTKKEDSSSRSIEACDLPQRVASYDADMELMHPNRSPMMQDNAVFWLESREMVSGGRK